MADLGKITYEAYREAVGGRAWNGDAMPAWEDMCADEHKHRLVHAWREAGQAAANAKEAARG